MHTIDNILFVLAFGTRPCWITTITDLVKNMGEKSWFVFKPIVCTIRIAYRTTMLQCRKQCLIEALNSVRDNFT